MKIRLLLTTALLAGGAARATDVGVSVSVGDSGFYGRIDVGQGLETSIAQMVAEEIDVALPRVKMVLSDTARTVNMGGASGALDGFIRATSAPPFFFSRFSGSKKQLKKQAFSIGKLTTPKHSRAIRGWPFLRDSTFRPKKNWGKIS